MGTQGLVSERRRILDPPRTETGRYKSNPNAVYRRINEAGHSVPSSQDSVTRCVQNLRVSDSPAAPAALPASPPSTIRNSRKPPRPKLQPWKFLRCAQCGPDPAAHMTSTDGGLVQLVGQKHGGQLLLADSVGQLRWLSRAACVACGTIRSQRLSPMQLLRERNFALGTLSRIDDSTGIRTQRPAVRQPVSNSLTARSQYLQGEPLDDSPIPNCSMRGVALTDPDKHFLTVLRQASAKALPRCVDSRYATAWAESLERAMRGHRSWALLCRYRSRLLVAEIPKDVDRNSELIQRLHLREMRHITVLISKVLGQ